MKTLMVIPTAFIKRKTVLKGFKRAYNEAEFAKSNSGFSRPFVRGVEVTPSLSYDLGVFLCLSNCGGRKLGGLMPCRSLGRGLLTRLSVASKFLAGFGSDSFNLSEENTMDNCIQNLPYPVNSHQKQILNKLLGRKRLNRYVLEALNNNGFILQIIARSVQDGWHLDLVTLDQQTATLKTLDGSKDKVFKSLDTVNEFLRDFGLPGFLVTSDKKEVSHA